jgi:diadenosine tetraphosphate (Ap4A) HIT family hydrolase
VSDVGRLWAGWRSAYVTGVGGEPDAVPVGEGQVPDCILCRLTAPAAEEAPAGLLWRGERCAAVLNAYPYTSGHLMVLPVRHVGELEDLHPAEAAELWDGVRRAVVALKEAYRPGGVNVGINLGRAAGAGVPGHLHVHAMPRWEGDTNFMTAVAGVRVMPEALPDSWAKLRGSWPD